MLIYSMILVIISIPASLFFIKRILDKEVDQALALHTEQFMSHIKTYEHIDDIDLDLKIWDELTYDVALEPTKYLHKNATYETVIIFDSLINKENPFRILKAPVAINNKNYVLVSRISLVDNNELLFAIGSVQVVLIIFLTTGLIWLSNSLSIKLWKPFYHTLEKLKKYQIEKGEAIRQEKTDIVEFDDLNQTIQQLTERNKNVYFEQKEFIENASHELQTPLAIIQAKLDNLMQSQELSEKSAQIILELEETTNRIARLNKSLLLISKIDNEQFIKKEEVEVNLIVERILNNILEITSANDIQIETNIQKFSLKANIVLIEVLILNLIHNAIRHTNAKGLVKIQLFDDKFSVANSSKEEMLDETTLFKRFSKKSNDETSNGLGLAIVKRICEVNHYTVQYKFEKNLHVFEVAFNSSTLSF